MNKWINVNDKMPDKDGTYLCYTKETKNYTETTIVQSYSETHGFSDIFGDIYETKITHWQPLPEAPNKEEEHKQLLDNFIREVGYEIVDLTEKEETRYRDELSRTLEFGIFKLKQAGIEFTETCSSIFGKWKRK